MQTYLVPLNGATTLTPAALNTGSGSFQAKWSFSFRVVSDKSMIVSGVGSVSGSAGAKRFRIVNQKTRESTPKRARGQLVLAATKHDRPSRLTPAQNLELEPVGFWRGQTFQRVLIGCRAGVSFSLIGRPQGG
jgi:hypothetical protein